MHFADDAANVGKDDEINKAERKHGNNGIHSSWWSTDLFCSIVQQLCPFVRLTLHTLTQIKGASANGTHSSKNVCVSLTFRYANAPTPCSAHSHCVYHNFFLFGIFETFKIRSMKRYTVENAREL